MTNEFKTKQDEIEQILNELCPEFKDRIKVQEYISRSIIANYYLIPRGTPIERIVYMPLDNDYYDIGIPSASTSIEVKERSSLYDGRFIIEETKFINLLMQRKPYYICYTPNDNKIFAFDLNKSEIQNLPIEELICNAITYESTTNKKNKQVRYLPIELAAKPYIADCNQFIDVKYKYVKSLTPEKIQNIIKR